MIDDWFWKNYHANRDKIDKFWEERPKGMKLCPNCQNIFNTSGYPVEGSWTCNEICSIEHNMRQPIIPQDTISRLYLLDLGNNIESKILTPTQYYETQKDDDIDIKTLAAKFSVCNPQEMETRGESLDPMSEYKKDREKDEM